MCGIAGIIGRLDEPNRAALERMNDAMVHRGPDAGEHGPPRRTPADGVRCWHTAGSRSSTSRRCPAAVDPVTGHVIVFNGEIYSFSDLRQRGS